MSNGFIDKLKDKSFINALFDIKECLEDIREVLYAKEDTRHSLLSKKVKERIKEYANKKK